MLLQEMAEHNAHSVKFTYLPTCHSQSTRIYNNADIVSVVIMQGVTLFRSNPHDMRGCIKDTICESKYLYNI